jgi:hypothetical protein
MKDRKPADPDEPLELLQNEQGQLYLNRFATPQEFVLLNDALGLLRPPAHPDRMAR